jgi:hypothetical protein
MNDELHDLANALEAAEAAEAAELSFTVNGVPASDPRALRAFVEDFDTIKAHMDSCSICAEALTGTGPRDKQTALKRLEHMRTVHPALATLIAQYSDQVHSEAGQAWRRGIETGDPYYLARSCYYRSPDDDT